MSRIKKVLISILIISFTSQDFLYSRPILNSDLRVPLDIEYKRIGGELEKRRSSKPPQQVVTSREEFRAKVLSMVISYLTSQYSSPVYSGLSPRETEKLFERYELSDSINDPSIIFDAIKLIMDNNMRFNHMYLGHMLTTPLALPIFINYIIDFINSNQADANTEILYQQIEYQTIQWLARMLGYRVKKSKGGIVSKPGGIVTSGGTTANMLALQLMRDTALNKALKDAGINEDVRSIGLQRALELLGGKEAVLFVSEEAHYSWQKIGGYEGIGSANVIGVKVDPQLRMDPEDLGIKVEQAKRDGKIILGIMATAGTTETGNIDPIEKILEVAKGKGDKIWVHIDGAYGGACAIAKEKELKAKLASLKSADSITIDPHKFLYIPYNFGALIVRDDRSLATIKPYFQSEKNGTLAQSFIAERRFDALKLWAALQWIGTDKLGNLIDHVNEITRYLYEKLRQDENFELLSTPEMDLFTFRYIPAELKTELETAINTDDILSINRINAKINELTKSIQKKLQQSGKGWLSFTGMKNSIYTQYAKGPEDASYEIQALRVVAMNPFINKSSMDEFYRIIKSISEEVVYEKARDLQLNVVSVPVASYGNIPETSSEKPFQDYFVHPDTSNRLEQLGTKIVNLPLDYQARSSITDADIEDFKKQLSEFTVPRSPIAENELLKKLAIIVKITGQKVQNRKVPEIPMAGNLVHTAVNPNQIGWEVSTTSTYAEAQVIKWLLDLFHYKAYIADLGGKATKITPGGIITNSSTMATLTALLVARNIAIERLLHNYNQENNGRHIDVTRDGFDIALKAIIERVTKNPNSRLVIVASESKEQLMKELVLFLGMSPEDVVVVKENEKGTVDTAALRKIVKEKKSKGHIVMMVAVNLGGMTTQEARILQKDFRDFRFHGNIWIHGFIGAEYKKYYHQLKEFMESVMRSSHSVTVDFQSLLGMPYGLGAAIFQNQALLKHYLKQSAPYVLRGNEADERLDLSGYSPEGSKGFQALGLFLTILVYGRQLKEAINGENTLSLDEMLFKEEPPLTVEMLLDSATSVSRDLLRKPLLKYDYSDIERFTEAAIKLLGQERYRLEQAYQEKLEELEKVFIDNLADLKEGEFSVNRVKFLLKRNENKIYKLVDEIRDCFIKLQLIENGKDSVLFYTLLTWQDMCTTGICKYVNESLRKAFISLGFYAFEVPVRGGYHYYTMVSKNHRKIAIDAAAGHIFIQKTPEIIVEEYERYKPEIDRAASQSALLLRATSERQMHYFKYGTRFLLGILSSL